MCKPGRKEPAAKQESASFLPDALDVNWRVRMSGVFAADNPYRTGQPESRLGVECVEFFGLSRKAMDTTAAFSPIGPPCGHGLRLHDYKLQHFKRSVKVWRETGLRGALAYPRFAASDRAFPEETILRRFNGKMRGLETWR
jgi:hypothetical protein